MCVRVKRSGIDYSLRSGSDVEIGVAISEEWVLMIQWWIKYDTHTNLSPFSRSVRRAGGATPVVCIESFAEEIGVVCDIARTLCGM